ncbi:MAG: hypothetical protein JO091_00175 [Acidobacteriaceae bacterium]|nr:hypothetical protein [Acidobacteriaceae bacterium]
MGNFSRSALVALAVLLLFSSTRCMTTCLTGPCQNVSQSNLPPCHRHHAPANHTTPACSHTLAIADTRHFPLVPAHLNSFWAVPSVGPIALFSHRAFSHEARASAPSPPPAPSLSSVILRI